MYDQSSLLIVSVLFVALVVATEAGYRIGHRHTAATSDATKAQINTMQASLLGVLALLLGFTFSLSLQRFDSRSQAVLAEANAIGTTILRAGLLPGTERPEAQRLLQQYLDLRVRAGTISLDREKDRAAVSRESNNTLHLLWQTALRAADADARPVTTGLFIASLNEMIDAYGSRDAALNRHVPEAVLFLLFGTFTMTACLVGFTSGITGHRAVFPTYILMLLIVFLVFIVIDLDRPRRGLIEVSQQSLIDLQNEQRATQFAEFNDQGVTFAHVHLVVADVELHKRLWPALFDVELVEKQGYAAVWIGGALIFFREAEPTAPSADTAMDHIGLDVRSVTDILSKWRALGYQADPAAIDSDGVTSAFITMPGGVRIELREDAKQLPSTKINHVHFVTPMRDVLMDWYTMRFGATTPARGDRPDTLEIPGSALRFEASEVARLPTDGTAIDHFGMEIEEWDAFVDMLEKNDVEFEFGAAYVDSLDLWVAFVSK